MAFRSGGIVFSMKLSKIQVVRALLMLVFFICMLFANFYAVRLMGRYGVELFFYDKLAVAYDIGGAEGMQKELQQIMLNEKFRRELVLADDFKNKLGTLDNPQAYLVNKVQDARKKIALLRNLRTIAIALMFIIFIWRLIAGLVSRYKIRKS